MTRKYKQLALAFVASAGFTFLLQPAMAGYCSSGDHCHRKQCGVSKCNCCLDMLNTVIYSLCCDMPTPCGTSGCAGVITHGSPSTMP